LHETGHAVGDLLGFDNSPALIEHHKRLHAKLDPYLQQGGAGAFAGRQELFAEGLAATLMHREFAIRKFDAEFVDWMEKEVLRTKQT
jgi:hypothetical protein